MTGLGAQHLTNLYTPEMKASIQATYPGQAHFGEPERGATCRECVRWGGPPPFRRVAEEGPEQGDLKPRRCSEFRRLMHGKPGKPVPHDALACRFFRERKIPPPIKPPPAPPKPVRASGKRRRKPKLAKAATKGAPA